MPDAVAWRVLAFTGGRRGEVLAVRWRDLDMDAGRLSIRRSVGVIKHKGKPAKLVEGPTKSGRERVVDLDAQTVEALRRYRVARAGLSLQLARDDALIFGDIEGHHQHPDHFSWRFIRQLARCRRQLGENALPAIRLHDTPTGNIGLHPRASKAFLSRDFTRSRHLTDIQTHLDAQAAVSREVSRAPTSAARSPPANPMH